MKSYLTTKHTEHLKICAAREYRKVDAKGIERCGVCGRRLKLRVWATCPKRKW